MNMQHERAGCWETPASLHRHHSRQPGCYTSDGILQDSASSPFFLFSFCIIFLHSLLKFTVFGSFSTFLQMSVHKCCEQMVDTGAAAITFTTLFHRKLIFLFWDSSPDCRWFFVLFCFLQWKNSICQFAFQQVQPSEVNSIGADSFPVPMKTTRCCVALWSAEAAGCETSLSLCSVTDSSPNDY